MTCVPALCTEPQHASAARFTLPKGRSMTATIYNIRDYQKLVAQEPPAVGLVEYVNALTGRVQPFGVDFSAAEPYHAPDKDSA